MAEIDFPPGSFDVIISSHAVFLGMYEGRLRERLVRQLQLFHDWLTPGGLIHIAGFDWDVLWGAVRNTPGLMVANGPYETASGNRTVTLKKRF